MRKSVFELNKGTMLLSKKKLNRVHIENLNKFSTSCYKLYDLGYIPSPSEFDSISFSSVFAEEFPNEISLFESYMDGAIDFSPLRIKFAMTKYKGDNEDFLDICKCMLDLVTAQEALAALDKVNEKYTGKKKDELPVKPRLGISTSVLMQSAIPLDNDEVLKCIKLDEGMSLRYFDTREALVKNLTKRVGVTDEQYENYRLSRKAFFLKGMTFKEEREFIDYIITGDVLLDGDFGSQLQAEILKYYKDTFESDSATGLTSLKFSDKVFLETIDERDKITSAESRKVENIGGKVFFVTSSHVIFQVPSERTVGLTSYFEDGFQIGNYAYNWATDEIMSPISQLLGISGEFISREDVMKLGYVASGKPVLIPQFVKLADNTLKVFNKEYFPIYNVAETEDMLSDRSNINKTSLRPKIGNDGLEFLSTPIEETLRHLGHYTKIAMFTSMRKKVLDSFKETQGASLGVGCKSYASLVADLVCALVYANSGCTDYSLCYDSYGFVTDDIYVNACYDACTIFSSLDV